MRRFTKRDYVEVAKTLGVLVGVLTVYGIALLVITP